MLAGPASIALAFLATIVFAPHQMAYADISLPAEPVAPTDIRECVALSQSFTAIERQLRLQAEQCHAASDKRGPSGVKCGAWVVAQCRAPLDQCEQVGERRKQATAQCRDKVRVAQEARRTAETQARAGAVALAERYVPGLRDARETYGLVKARMDTVQSLNAALFGNQGPAARYGFVADQASAARALAGGPAVSRKVFDLSLKRLNTHHRELLATLDRTGRDAAGIGTQFETGTGAAASSGQARMAAFRADMAAAAKQAERVRIAEAEQRRLAAAKRERQRQQEARRVAEQRRLAAERERQQQAAHRAAAQHRLAAGRERPAIPAKAGKSICRTLKPYSSDCNACWSNAFSDWLSCTDKCGESESCYRNCRERHKREKSQCYSYWSQKGNNNTGKIQKKHRWKNAKASEIFPHA